MKLLTKIIMIQWYLFEAEEIRIVGQTAIVGRNGSGKSSIIDGVQLVLCGGDKNKISLNKGSNEKSSRTVREYCLGIVNDPESNIRVEPRDNANTYLALCFYDDETGTHTCAGVSLWSSLTNPKEEIQGYFITKGECLSVDDFVECTPEGKVVKEWKSVAAHLQQRYRPFDTKEIHTKPRGLLLPNKGPGYFTEKMFTHLSAEPGMPMNSTTAVKALISAIAFKPIKDTTKFVRDNMLEPEDINIRELKDSLTFWRDFRDKAKQTASNIQTLDELEQKCHSVVKHQADIENHEHALYSARIDQCYDLAGPLEEQKEDLDDRISEEKSILASCRTEHSDMRVLLSEKEADYARQDSTQKINQLNLEILQVSGRIETKQKEISLKRDCCLNLEPIFEEDPLVSRSVGDKLAVLLSKTRIEQDLLSDDWPKEPQTLDNQLNILRAELPDELQMLKSSRSHLFNKMSPLVQDNIDRANLLERLRGNKAPLSKSTLGLVSLLENNRIKSVPLCDLVEVKKDEIQWQPIIESILGNSREALIVDPTQARSAIRIYRYDGKAYRGGMIVNTTKTEEWLDKSQPGSLAEKIITTDPHARAFINLRLGNVLCVEDEKDLLDKPRAATVDMMYTSGGVNQMRYEPNYLILGKKARERQKKKLISEIEETANRINILDSQEKRHAKIIDLIDTFIRSIHEDASTFTSLVADRESLQASLEKKMTDRDLLIEKSDTKLKQIIEGLKVTILKLEGKITQYDESYQANIKAQARLQAQIEGHHQLAEQLSDERQKLVESRPNMDRAGAADILNRLLDRFSSSEEPYAEVLIEINSVITSRKKLVKRNEEQILDGLKGFLATYDPEIDLSGDHAEEMQTFEGRMKYIVREKERLIGTTLALYEKRTEDALIDVERLFRDKFIGRIAEQLKKVRDDISGLNRILKERTFHDEYYQFRIHPDNELRPIYDFAVEVERDHTSIGDVGSLFDPENDPNSPHLAAIRFIKDSLQDEALGKRVQDYRNYFSFDVEIYDAIGNKIGNLKHRIDKGSGGEGMLPYYIAIGSSLAAAFKIAKSPSGKVYAGICLSPFDEAFSKLDTANIYNCFAFMKEINLQVLLAAPDEKYTTLAALVDTVVRISRKSGNIHIETEILSEKTRNLLRSDYPYQSSEGNDDSLDSEPEMVHAEVQG